MFENKFVSLPSHLKTIEPLEVHRGAGTMCNTKTSKVISRTDPMIQLLCFKVNTSEERQVHQLALLVGIVWIHRFVQTE